MSQTSASEPPILATQVGVLEHFEEQADVIEPFKPKSQEALVKRLQGNVFNASTVSETSDHSSSLLWTPAAQPLTRQPKEPSPHRSHRKSHKSKRRPHKDDLHKEEKTTESEETSAILSKQEHEKQAEIPLCSFERDYQHSRRKSRNSSGRNSSRRSNKKHQELYNDYTRYQYHRRSHRDKHRKHKSRSQQRDDPETSATSGLPKMIKRLKDFFFGKKTEESEEHHHGKKSPKEHKKHHSEEQSMSRKHKHEISGKLFRSASDSDLEVVKHHHRRAMHKKGVKDDLSKSSKHWKSRHHDNKLPSICESSDRSGRLGSGSDAGKLILTRSGKTLYNDFAGQRNGDVRRPNGHCKKAEKDTSEGSHSMESSHSKRRYRRRSKEYQSLKKKWAKQHQSFENDLEKLEKLVELIGMKKTQGWLEQKSTENTSLLERLEATQEKCVAEVDFTRHVLICKLQRLENKLEESLSTIDYNNNNTLTDEKGRGIEEIREEMSKECRDLRKLLQETSNQLKQVLDEKPTLALTDELDNNDHGQSLQGSPLSVQKPSSRHSQSTNDELNTTDIPFPELSHHPLNTVRSRNCKTERQTQENLEKQHAQPTRVTTYV